MVMKEDIPVTDVIPDPPHRETYYAGYNYENHNTHGNFRWVPVFKQAADRLGNNCISMDFEFHDCRRSLVVRAKYTLPGMRTNQT